MKFRRIIYLFLIAAVTVPMTLVYASESSNKTKIIRGEERSANDRKNLRAFYTAPPVIPHEVESRDSKDCLRCHATVTDLGSGRIAMATPHPQFTNCQQCHVSKDLSGLLQVDNSWRGLEEPQYGERWSGVSPPMIPHRTFLRENCLSCHGAEHPNMRMRTPHPNRTSCTQCHVPNASREF